MKKQIKMKTEDTDMRCFPRPCCHVKCTNKVTRVNATNNSIATSLIRHLGHSDKVGKSNERTTS
jgi:hypothetical protein